MTTGESLAFPVIAVAKHRTDGVNYMLCCEPSARSDDGAASGQPANLADDDAAFGKDRRAAGSMNLTVDSTVMSPGP
jgi:hypothetical protein